MYLPSTAPPASVFYRYEIHPYRRTPDRDTGRASAPVVIVGAGPVGLLTALDLARFGVASIVFDEDLCVSHGSRAIVLTRRSLEILQQIGVEKPFRLKGLPWSFGRSFYRGKEIYRMVMPHDEDDRFLPGLNIQQQYIEEYLVDFCKKNPLIDLRWGQKLVGISQTAKGVRLRLDTPEGEYPLIADWVVAADGGRSTIRKLLGLKMEGRSYAGNFVIADIKAKIDLPTERLCHFDPAWNPGNNVLVHRQPDDLWRIDFRLPDGETAEAALEPSALSQRIDAVLEMIGQKTPWQLDWATVYSANTLTLTEFVHGHVLFTGDAAHLLPIFGVRGCNTGLQDCNNMAWKLAFVVNGWATPALLATYSSERVRAAREVCEEGGKSTRFMTPPTAGSRLMRDAVLSLCLSEDFPKDLLHWRTSRAHEYRLSPLNSFPEADAAFTGGIATGHAVRNVKLGADDYLLDRLKARAGFHVLAFGGDGGRTADIERIFLEVARLEFPVIRVFIRAPPAADRSSGAASASHADVTIDDDGRIARKYDAAAGTVYVLRPDLHVCARWRRTDATEVCRALAIGAGSIVEG
ncbi:MAG TPA: FAD-dependent monooxygenase [Steroidobacteraceae bacterium]|nr:FAD-dependent monooxygenase [Steroidobacteraceae bacterium]